LALQHFTAVELDLALLAHEFEIHGVSAEDSSTERNGDFLIKTIWDIVHNGI
jgi:hypothetical protein